MTPETLRRMWSAWRACGAHHSKLPTTTTMLLAMRPLEHHWACGVVGTNLNSNTVLVGNAPLPPLRLRDRRSGRSTHNTNNISRTAFTRSFRHPHRPTRQRQCLSLPMRSLFLRTTLHSRCFRRQFRCHGRWPENKNTDRRALPTQKRRCSRRIVCAFSNPPLRRPRRPLRAACLKTSLRGVMFKAFGVVAQSCGHSYFSPLISPRALCGCWPE